MWFRDGSLHREGAPAYINMTNNTEEWYENGVQFDKPKGVHIGYYADRAEEKKTEPAVQTLVGRTMFVELPDDIDNVSFIQGSYVFTEIVQKQTPS